MIGFALVNIAVFALFAAWPQLDLATAAAAQRDGRFVADQGGLVQALRMTMWNLSLALVLAAVLALSLAHHFAWPRRLLPVRQWNVIFWSFLLGPGLLVNALLKTYSGRPRPVDTDLFGGAHPFAAVGNWAGACQTNCSFVSGEVSGTTALCLACALLIQHHRARLGTLGCAALYAALALGFAYVFGHRVLSGGHFLSDALLASTLTAWVFAIVAAKWPMPAAPGPSA